MTSSSEAIGQTKKSEFLLELFSEEIPARMQAKAAADLKRLITDKLKEAGLRFEQADAYVTPRRLCLHIAAFVLGILKSLEVLGIDMKGHDIRFVEDDWESPTLGAWGLGWEVWCDGMEVSQFTYFQQVGGFDCRPVMGELTYGLERLAMYIQGVDNVYDLDWNGNGVTYGDIFLQNEKEFSAYNFEMANTDRLFQHFKDAEDECRDILAHGNYPLPAYDQCIKASHAFNMLDARGVISVTERQAYIGRVRALAKACCEAYLVSIGEGAES